MEGQVHLRLRVPPRHGREDVCDWADVCSGANEHDNHRLHAHLLQVQQSFHTLKPVVFECFRVPPVLKHGRVKIGILIPKRFKSS